MRIQSWVTAIVGQNITLASSHALIQLFQGRVCSFHTSVYYDYSNFRICAYYLISKQFESDAITVSTPDEDLVTS